MVNAHAGAAREHGASCGDAVVDWLQDGIRYSVGLKAGREDDVVRMAKAAVP